MSQPIFHPSYAINKATQCAACRKHLTGVTFSVKGRDEEFCSRFCRATVTGEPLPTPVDPAQRAVVESPKATPPKGKAKTEEPRAPRTALSGSIKLLPACPKSFNGQRGEAFALLKDGDPAAEYIDRAGKAGAEGKALIRFLQAKGYAEVK